MAEATEIREALMYIRSHIKSKITLLDTLADDHRKTYERLTSGEDQGGPVEAGHYLGRSEAYNIARNEMKHLEGMVNKLLGEGMDRLMESVTKPTESELQAKAKARGHRIG